ncbi:hypothetical protein FPOA_13459 [Fusarium poae]|uniref:Uncharacterized protein n=1 Tax=Fusarium poae TaxID=36050 RepID=A0A1B8A5G8_FUSPO|nr:hypothetical protein FPOA_13459 [Fusarium poae]
MGAQAITGAFKTVSMAVAEVEAGILPIDERHAQAGTRLYVNMQTLPKTHPLATLKVRETRRYLSPLTKLALAHDGAIERMETIEPFALPPWHRHIVVEYRYDLDKEAAADTGTGDDVTGTSSMRQVLRHSWPERRAKRIHGRAGSDSNGPEVHARWAPTPRGTIREIYKHAERVGKGGNTITMRWVSPTNVSFTLGAKAKTEARKATDSGCRPTKPLYQARSTRLRVLLAQRRQHMVLPESVGSYSKQLDRALPGKHTRTLYDALKRRESDILVQLRTGMARVNRYLHRIGAAETDTCDCGQEEETVDHFLF